jgi:hypothetical protein
MWTKSTGTFLIVIGIIMMIYTGFTYITTEKVIDVGAIQINHEEKHPVQWSPIIGGVLLAGGIIILVTNRKVSA